MNNQVDVIAGIGLDQKDAEKSLARALGFCPERERIVPRSFYVGTYGFRLDDPDQQRCHVVGDQDVRGTVSSSAKPIPASWLQSSRWFRLCSCFMACSRCASFPRTITSIRSFASHRKMLRHEDTTLWWVQACDRLCALFSRFRSSVPDARAPRRYRPLRVGGSSVERQLVAAVSGPVVCRGAARRRRPLPVGGQVGLVRGRRSQSDARDAQTIQVGNHCISF